MYIIHEAFSSFLQNPFVGCKPNWWTISGFYLVNHFLLDVRFTLRIYLNLKAFFDFLASQDTEAFSSLYLFRSNSQDPEFLDPGPEKNSSSHQIWTHPSENINIQNSWWISTVRNGVFFLLLRPGASKNRSIFLVADKSHSVNSTTYYLRWILSWSWSSMFPQIRQRD